MNFFIENEHLSVVVSSKGAELQSIKDSSGREVLWQGDPDYWGRRSPVLFPIVGRLIEGTYEYQGHWYKMSGHGFARDMDFLLDEKTGDGLTFLLVSDASTLAVYPFDFKLYLAYRLVKNRLVVTYRVVNGSDVMYFSIGGHPAFNCEMDASYLLVETDALESLTVTSGGISDLRYPVSVADGRLLLTPALFENDALVLKDALDKIVLVTENHNVRMNFAGFPYLGIWSKGGGPFVCLEPWYGLGDMVSHNQKLVEKEGVLCLKSDEIFEASYEIIVDRK